MAPRCFSVVIADRHPLFLCGLKSVLQAECEFKVVAACQDGTTGLKAIRDLSPDLALLDVCLPSEGGLAILAAISSENIRTRVIFLSASLGASAGVTAIAGGAYGIIPQEATPLLLVRSLRKVAAGQKLLPVASWDPELRDGQHGSPGRFEPLCAGLTERERQVVLLVREGLSNKEVGRQLNLSEGTIKVHLHRVYQKLVIRNRTALAVMAKGGLTGPGLLPVDGEGVVTPPLAANMKARMNGLSRRDNTRGLSDTVSRDYATFPFDRPPARSD
jgi:DNA-binding NarL/FixJ family response regulator